MTWHYLGLPIEEIPADKPFGFIYELTFSNGKKYIGKKQMLSIQTIPALKTGIPREGSTRVNKNVLRFPDGKIVVSRADKARARNTGLKATRESYDIITKESNWKTYTGSSEAIKDLEIVSKEILRFCKTEKELTYREEEALFYFEVLESDIYLNDNIGGRYFKFVNGVIK